MEGGSLHPRFDLRGELGRGGFGVVYEAFDRERGLVVALKHLIRLDDSALAGFKEEFRALSELQHPGLPVLHELFAYEGAWFFTMELVRGLDFVSHTAPGISGIDGSVVSRSETNTMTISGVDAVLRSHEPHAVRASMSCDETRVRAALEQLCAVVEAVHAEGKVHRDIKPSNVRVRSDGRVFLLDFGLASSAFRATGRFEGTPAYAAPEQGLGAIGPEADWYAVGTMLFRVLTGRYPFTSDGLQSLVDKQHLDPPRVLDVAPHVPADLAALCDGWLVRDPRRRAGAPSGRARARPSAGAGFVGRAREREQLEKALAHVRSGIPRLVLVEGQSGIGKTALLTTFIADARAAARDVVVLHGRASHKERVPYNAFDGVFASLAELDGGPVWPGAGAVAEGARLDTMARVRARLAELARDRLLILWLDDVQWADADSRALLQEVLREPDVPPMLTVLSRRLRDARDVEYDLPSTWSVERLPLGPLSEADARALALALGAAEADARRAVETSGGHPLFLQELVRSVDMGATRGIDEAILLRVGRLSDDSRSALELIAISASPLTAPQIAKALGRGAEMTGRALEELRQARFVRSATIRATPVFLAFHDRVRESVAAALGIDRRRALHEALASVLDADDDGDAAALVEHLAQIGRVVEAADCAERAAARAEGALAFDQAAAFLAERIALLPRDVQTEKALRIRRLRALELAMRARDAGEECLAIAALEHDTRDALRWKGRAAQLLLSSGHLDRGSELLGQLLEGQGETFPRTEPATIAALAKEQVRQRLALAGLRRPRVDDVASLETRLGVTRAAADGLGMVDHVRGRLFQMRALDLALSLGEPRALAEALVIESMYLGCEGKAARVRARELLSRATTVEPGGPSERTRAWHAAVAAILDGHDEPTDEIIGRIAASEKRFATLDSGNAWIVNGLSIVRGMLLHIVGDLNGLRTMATQLLRDAERREDRFLHATTIRGASVLALADDDPEAARRALEASAWPAHAGAFHIQNWLDVEARAETALYEGGGAEVYDQYRRELFALRFSLVTRLQSVRVLARTLVARVLLARAADGRAVSRSLAEVRTIAFLLRREQVGYGRVRAALLGAGIAMIEADEARAVSFLNEAVTCGKAHDLSLSAAVAEYLLGALRGGSRGAELQTRARGELSRYGIKRPERFVLMEVPGFRRVVERAVSRR